MEIPYNELVSAVYDIMNNDRLPNPKSDDEILEIMLSFSKKVTLYGSNKAVKKWAIYRESADKEVLSMQMLNLENLLFQLRKDLGLKKRGLKETDLLRLFFNDMDEIIQKNPDVFKKARKKNPT